MHPISLTRVPLVIPHPLTSEKSICTTEIFFNQPPENLLQRRQFGDSHCGKGARGKAECRLEELENDRKKLTEEIGIEELKKPLLSKERIAFWLYSFKNGSIDDENYKRTIVDTLVNSIYVYDTQDGGRKVVFTFNISGNNTTTVEGSSIVGLTALKGSNLNPQFFFVGHIFGFVLVVSRIG